MKQAMMLLSILFFGMLAAGVSAKLNLQNGVSVEGTFYGQNVYTGRVGTDSTGYVTKTVCKYPDHCSTYMEPVKQSKYCLFTDSANGQSYFTKRQGFWSCWDTEKDYVAARKQVEVIKQFQAELTADLNANKDIQQQLLQKYVLSQISWYSYGDGSHNPYNTVWQDNSIDEPYNSYTYIGYGQPGNPPAGS